MGERIVVETKSLGDLAVFTGDRSITRQDREAYSSHDDAFAASTPAAKLAGRLFAGDPAISHVSAESNIVKVNRNGGWNTAALTEARRAFEMLFSSPVVSADVVLDSAYIDSLREANYNATITLIAEMHETLWIMYVRPDDEMPSYQAGQYATLGLGHWEPRVDIRQEDTPEGQIEKLIRRSYSISSSILGANGDLLNPETDTALEFYVVLVDAEWPEPPPLLTPRLFGKEEGDRIFLGRKTAGRYRLDKLTSDAEDVVFLATGTGEAPHNRMVLDLLRGGHRGQIVSVCTSRYLRDLAYIDIQNELMDKYDNYRYIPMTTREPENEGNKIYIQDLVKAGGLDEALGKQLDPASAHVYICGNPAMIGPPEWDGDVPRYPEIEGVVEILAARGFTIDRRGVAGNVHYEEYW